MFWAPGKTADAKLAMYRRIVERLGTNPGVRPEDVLISVVETAAENWSFGNGETQFYVPDGERARLTRSSLTAASVIWITTASIKAGLIFQPTSTSPIWCAGADAF